MSLGGFLTPQLSEGGASALGQRPNFIQVHTSAHKCTGAETKVHTGTHKYTQGCLTQQVQCTLLYLGQLSTPLPDLKIAREV